jgi:Tfp pilus assembly protein PilF
MFAVLSAPLGWIRRRPLTAYAVLAAVVLAATGGVYAYAHRQWGAARAALADYRPEDARAPLDFCLLVWPRRHAVLVLAARAARLTRDFKGAETLLHRCLALGREDAREAAQVELMLLRVQAGEVDAVRAPLLACVDNGHAEGNLILETLAGAYMSNLRYKEALDMLDRWIKADPTSPIAYQYRGWVMDRAAVPDGALRDYRRAVELGPERDGIRLRLAELLLQSNIPDEASVHIEHLLRKEPGRPDALARLGQCRFQQGEVAEARRLLEEAEPSLPDDPALLAHLAKLDLKDKKYADAERRLRRLLELEPADTEGQFTLAAVLRRRGRDAEADILEKRSVEMRELLKRLGPLLNTEVGSSTGPEAPHEAGVALLRLGQDRLGLHWLREALRRDPRHAPTHRALADHYEAMKDQERAAFHRRQAGKP